MGDVDGACPMICSGVQCLQVLVAIFAQGSSSIMRVQV